MHAVQKLPSYLERNLGNALIVCLLSLLYLPLILHWYDGWLNKSISIEHEYFSHGLIGLPYAAYVIFGQHRKKWQQLKQQSHPLGIILIIAGIILYSTGAFEFVNFSFPVMLLGITLWLKGIPGFKLNWLPLLLIFLATPNPIPYLITPYTLPLQKFIAGVAGFFLMQLGFEASVNQIYLTVNGQSVEVAPYCAGLKMLFTSLYVTLILLHWTGNLRNSKRVVTLLTGAAVISIIANIIRNTLLALFHGNGDTRSFELLHEGQAGDLYSVLMLVAIVGLNWWMDRTEPKQHSPIIKEENHLHE